MYAGPPCRVSETSFISQRLHGRARAPASRLEYLKGSPLQKSNRLECGTIHDQFEVPLKFFLPCRLGRHPCPTLFLDYTNGCTAKAALGLVPSRLSAG